MILIIMFYTLFTLFETRRQLSVEGMSNQGSIDAEINKMKNDTSSGITSLTQNNNSHVLRQYCIKSSYNSAVQVAVDFFVDPLNNSILLFGVS
jgi:hypothetical protein